MTSRAQPSDADSLMASALLAISRANEAREGANSQRSTDVDGTPRTEQQDSTMAKIPVLLGNHVISSGFNPLYFGDAVSKVQPRLSLNTGLETSSESTPLLSGYSAFPAPVKIESAEAQVNHLALQAAMISEKAIAASLLNGTLAASEIPLGGHLFFPSVTGGDSSPEKSKNIRRQEIVKALHSKPQRGRKRANLNDIERLELTRTRNREHAKSTRVRKKMRYEELLNCEKVLRENKLKEELDSRRRGRVVDLLSIREQMVRNQLLPASLGDCNAALKLDAIVEDVGALVFDDGSSVCDKSNALDRMNQFDVALSSALSTELVCRNDAKCAESISYKIRGASPVSDVALTAFGVAFAEVDVVSKSTGNDNQVLRSYLLKVEFAPGSDKIRSVLMREISVPLVEAEKRRHVLENQISHPSVVSLDAEKDPRRELDSHYEKQADSDDVLGAVMTF